jgi:RNA polymerase sigma factor (sigma-70 family)
VEDKDNLLLALAANRRDRAAIETLYAKYYSRIKCYIRLKVQSEQEAEDLAQSVFVELCKGNVHYPADRDPQAYLLGVARNLVVRYDRCRRRQPKTVPMGAVEDRVEGLPARSQCTNKGLLLERLGMVLAAMRDRPSTKANEALVLRFVDGLSVKEAARRAGCSTSAFYQRLYYAMEKLEERRAFLVSGDDDTP